MQPLVLWSGMAMVTLFFMTALFQIVKTPDQQDSPILYEQQSYRRRQWGGRIVTLFRWGFASMAFTFWCVAIGYMGYVRLHAG